MKLLRCINLILTLTLLAACGLNGGGSGTPSLPSPIVGVTSAPSAETALKAYLEAVKVEDYPAMYGMLTQASQAAITLDDFTKRYKGDFNAMSLQAMDYNLLSTLTNPGTAQIAYHIVYHTVLFGEIPTDIVANFNLENGAWRLQWNDGLILPQLSGGNVLKTDFVIPARGDIYDRSGNAVVTQTDAIALGLIAGQASPEQETALFSELSRLTAVSQAAIRKDYENYLPGQYVPVGETDPESLDARMGVLSGLAGWLMNTYNSRYSYLSSQAVGYTQPVFREEVDEYSRKGYSSGQRVGRIGVEKWGEQYLAGRNGASLYIVDPEGKIVNTLARTDSQPADSIYLTIDRDLQEQAQLAMDGLPGAIVVIEVDTGRVLAMVSSPGLDANLFDAENYNYLNLPNVLSDLNQPLVNRASQGAYPLGSVFKVITMAAALESGVFTAESTYDCQYQFTDIPNHILYDWTWEHCQEQKLESGTDECSTQPSGMLTLPEGLMRSCDPWFYHISFELWNQSKGNLISDMARAFGLGQATGIAQVSEVPGNIPDPSDGLNATSIAIGQGNVLVTPLQVATFMAAIGNGGTLYKPQLVEKVQPVIGDPINVFKPEAQNTLPVSSEHLKIIQEAMRSVVKNPRGTAYARLGSFSIPVAAKTGTAESGVADPHAWFAGYSFLDNPDRPDIAVAVIVENEGEGSIWAAPIFKRVMEIYFFGKPQTIYPWEADFGRIRPTDTPEPATTP